MRKTILALVTLAVAIAVVPTAVAAGEKDKAPKLTTVKLLGFNDLHGHLEANTPGTISVGCCTASGGPINVAAGGAEYFATHIKALGSSDPDTYILGAGDMIGGSPLLSGLFHDEPTIEFMNYIGVDTVGVGNHEFDEGRLELLRMQYGDRSHEHTDENSGSSYTPARADGCHPVDGCQDGTPFSGSVFQYLAANVIDDDTDNPLLPAYSIVNTSVGEKIAFIGETLQGTPEIVTPSGVAGLTFLDEADTVNMLVPRLQRRGVETIVLLLHQGGFQNAPFSRGYQEVDACENFTGPELLDVVNRLHPAVDVVLSAHTHSPYVCTINGKLVTSASSFGRVISKIDLTIDRRTGDVVSKTADNVVVTQTVAKDAGATALIARYKVLSDPIANRVVAKITADIRSSRSPGGFTSFSREQEMGNLVADAQEAATKIEHHGGSDFALMNPGGVRAHLLYAQISGGEQPGEVTYGELFAVQPFGNSLVVKTCTGQQIYNVLTQQFVGPTRTAPLVLLPSDGLTYQYYTTPPAGQPNVVDGSVKIDGVVVDKAASYRVTMNSFLADGGDGFPAFRTCTEPLGGEVDVDALGRYMAERSPVGPPAVNRIERLN